MRTEPFGDVIGTHGVKCKFHKYKPKTVAKPEVEKAPVVEEQPAPTE